MRGPSCVAVDSDVVETLAAQTTACELAARTRDGIVDDLTNVVGFVWRALVVSRRRNAAAPPLRLYAAAPVVIGIVEDSYGGDTGRRPGARSFGFVTKKQNNPALISCNDFLHS